MGRYSAGSVKNYGVYPGIKTPITPDEPGAGQPDVLDTFDGVEGLGIHAHAKVSAEMVLGLLSSPAHY
jgi:hypothetical protein